MAMNKARRTANLNNILTYDTLGNSTLIANLTVEGLTGAGFVKADAAGLLSVDTAAYTVVTGATNYLTKITAPNTLGQSLVYDNGTSVYINTAVGVTGYSHAFQVMANGAGGLVVSTTDVASAIGIVNSASANKTWDISPYGNHLVINESGIATRMKFDAGGNITIGDIVNTGHKLEIVGSFRTTGTNTLSQLQGVGDRMVVANTNGVLTTQPIPTGSITGSGAAGQVNFWTGTNTVSGSNNLFWDNANGRLGIGTNTPANDLSIVKTVDGTVRMLISNPSTGISAVSDVLILGNAGGLSLQVIGSNHSTLTPNQARFRSSLGLTNGLTFLTGTTAPLTFGTNDTVGMTMFGSTRNVVLQNGGTFTDGGQRLQVIGDTLLRGSGNTNSTLVLTAQNSDSANVLRVFNGGSIGIGNATDRPLILPFTTSAGSPTLTGTNLSFFSGTGTQAATQGIFAFENTAAAQTSGNNYFIRALGNYRPTSGTGTYAHIRIEGIINQTGGANGITRGIWIDPTLTAAADWRSIEWSNNSGWGLYGAGTANNYIAGKLLLNTTTTTNTEQLTVGGNVLLRPTGVAGTFAETSVKFYSASDSGFGAKIFTTDNSGYGIGLGISTRDGATESEKFRVFRNGNTVIQNGGTFTDLGQRLQVMGDTFVRGTGNTNTTNALAVQNSDSVNIFRVRNDATLSIGSFSENPLIYSSDFTGGVSANGASLTFNVQNGTSGSGRYIFTGAAKSSTAVSGNQNLVVYIQSFAPTSGGVSYNVLDVQPTINQIGGANGITRGIYINPVLTAAADFRAIEVSSGITVLAPSTTTSASLRLPNGVAPTTPIDGDVWSSSTDLLARIGGTTYSLINSGLSGSGTAGQVTYWSSASGLTGSANLFWDNTNSRLGIATPTPSTNLEITGTSAIGFLNKTVRVNKLGGANIFEISNQNKIDIFRESNADNQNEGIFIHGPFPNTFGANNNNKGIITFINNNGAADLYSGIQAASSNYGNVRAGVYFVGGNSIRFVSGSTVAPNDRNMFFSSSGNLSIGSTSDAGQRLQVYGDTLLRGSGNDSSTFALTVQSNNQNNILRVRNDQKLLIGQASTSAAPAIYAFEGTVGLRSLRIGIQSAGSLTPIPAFNINQENDYTYTTGTGEFTTITANFLPTSGTGTLAYLSLKGTINQTGGANGITRGLYVNPTLTSAADFRAIETTVGKVIFAGAGNVMIGSATDDTVNKLQVTGTIVAGSATSTNGSVILRGSYTNGYLTTVGADASSGGPMLSYGVESAQNSTAGAFVSSSGITIPRSAYVQNGGHVWHTAASSTTAIGTAITMTKHMELYNSGNLVLGGGADDAVNRLQVGGRAIISSTSIHQLEVANPSGGRLLITAQAAANSFTLLDSQGYGFSHTTGVTGINARQTNIQIWTQAADTTTLGLGGQDVNPTVARTRTFVQPVASATTAFAPTSGTAIDYFFRTTGNTNFQPTSGTATYTQVQFSPVINQTGGSNGVTRGLLVSPTLTAAADWRSIEWSNNTGWGLYGVGTAKNYLNGTTLIGTATDDGINKLQVAGSIASTGIMRSDASRTAAINDVSIALLGSNITTYAAGFTMAGAGYGLNAVYAQHEQRFGGNADFDSANLVGAGLMLNKLAPTAAGTVTMGQAAGRIRTMSNLHLMTQFSGNNNLTVTHMSGLHIYGHYRTSGSGVLTVSTAYYGIFLADPNEFSTGATVTGGNYGFYQQGAAPYNYFGGKVSIGTTATDGTSKLRISGLPTSSAGLLTGEVWNNGGVLSIV